MPYIESSILDEIADDLENLPLDAVAQDSADLGNDIANLIENLEDIRERLMSCYNTLMIAFNDVKEASDKIRNN